MSWLTRLLGADGVTQLKVDATPGAARVIQYDSFGRVIDNIPTYYLYQTPRVTTAAATDYFDLFNAAGSGKSIKLMGLWPIIQTTAAAAIVPSFQWSLIMTSAVGTGGTAHTNEGAAAGAAGVVNISRVDDSDTPLSTAPLTNITARSIPTGGATALRFLLDTWIVVEETLSSTVSIQYENILPVGRAIKEIILPEGRGVKMRQITATASTGFNFGWLLAFGLY